jgi:glycosyltransferase involved in cell wall biosynthesis
MTNPLVSVVIPAYNRPGRTRRAVASVVNQTYDPLELIVIDDGSSPPISESVTLPEEPFEQATLVTHETNHGANAARNTGLDHANGTYVAFLDSDDEWEPEKISRQIEQLEADTPYEASYTGVRQLDAAGNLNGIQRASVSGDIQANLLRGNIIGTFSSFVIARDVIESIGRPDPAMPCWQDWEWFLRLSTMVSFGGVPDPLTVRHNEGGQISSAFEQKRDEAGPVIEKRIRDLAPTERTTRIGVAYLHFQIGKAALKKRKYTDARRYFAYAIRHSPSQYIFYIYLILSSHHYPIILRAKRFYDSYFKVLYTN